MPVHNQHAGLHVHREGDHGHHQQGDRARAGRQHGQPVGPEHHGARPDQAGHATPAVNSSNTSSAMPITNRR